MGRRTRFRWRVCRVAGGTEHCIVVEVELEGMSL